VSEDVVVGDTPEGDDAPMREPGGPPVHVKSLKFNDGSTLDLEPGHVVVFVGANNVGKSNALRDIAGGLRSERRSGHKVVIEVAIEEPEGHPEPLRTWVRTRFPRFRPNATSPMMYGTGQGTVNEAQLDEAPLKPQTIQQIRRVVTFVANAQERLALTNPSQPFDSRRSGPQTPLQAIYNNAEKVEELSNASQSAFGVALTYSHHDGHWRLRLGKPEVEPEVTGRHLFPTPETKAAIEALEVVEEQGDGLRSYLGVLLELLAERHVFVVLDEPEAFLHPPQARQLASAVLEVKPNEAQLFVATHDSNFVRGLLDIPEARLSIVRVSRDGQKNSVAVIQPQTVAAVAKDAVLRHSNILDAMFHSAAVVCEAEADCLLYESVAVDGNRLPAGMTVHFAGSSGKQRVTRTCELLRDLAVPTAAIVDFDIFKRKEDVRALVAAVGGDVAAVDSRLSSVVAQLADLATTEAPTKDKLVAEIEELLGDVAPTAELTPAMLRRVSELARQSGQWSQLKRHGVHQTKGTLHSEVQQLVEDLAEQRVHVVPAGELESWFRDAPGKGSPHVAHILDEGWHTDPNRSRTLTAFVDRVLESLRAAD
jgi:predicted ATPase